MKSKFKLLESVAAARDITEAELTGAWGRGKPALIHGKLGVKMGTRGAVVEVFETVGDVGVEFFDRDGETIDVAFIPEAYVRPAPRDPKAPGGETGMHRKGRR